MPAPAATSRAVRFEEFGEPSEVLAVARVPAPRPGPGEALLRMTARPVNPSDLSLVRGRYGTLPDLPATPGLEGVGVVERPDPDGVGPPAGTRVVPLTTAPGTWADRMVAPVAMLVPVPDAVPDEHAAQLVVNPLTAWVLLHEELALAPGDWLLQSAAGSTLGRIVLQLARARGLRTINVVRRAEQAEELRDLGADEIVVGADDLAERVRAITGGAGVPAAIDAVGGETGAAMAASLATHGTMITYGRLSQQPTPLDGGALVFRGTTVRGFWLVHWFHRSSPETVRDTVTAVLGAMADGSITPPVEATYPLEDVREAVAHAERPGRSGKVLLIG
ncbi:MAG: zinc-dependent alcohol dehydrogenase family protein [Thermoleophilia bacterium]